jgi:diguanylate cyclase (GGDEF)-like protein/PAS domain S-box-containing protein
MRTVDDSHRAEVPVASRPLVVAIEDDPARALRLAALFRDGEMTLSVVASIEAARAALRSNRVHAILLSTCLSRRFDEAACRSLVEASDGCRIVWLIDDQDVVRYDEALQAGVAGVYYRDQLWPPAAFLRRIGITPAANANLVGALSSRRSPATSLSRSAPCHDSESRTPTLAADAERARLDALRRYAILDTPRESAFDRITRLAAELTAAPFAMISLADSERQWFKSTYGIDIQEVPREGAMCDFTIRDGSPLVIADATRDPRFESSPLVVGTPYIRFYAGVPLTTEDGFRIGTLCVIDQQPRATAGFDVAPLADLAEVAIELIRLRSLGSRLMHEVAERQQSQAALQESERRFRDFAETASDWFWEMDEDLRFSYFSERYTDQTGEPVTARLGMRRDEAALRDPGDDDWETHLADLEARREFRNFVYAYRHQDGRRCHAETSGKPIFDEDGHFLGYRGSARDITARRRAEAQVRHLALHDPLTGLPNRRLLRDRLDRALAAASRSDGHVAVMMLDLDRFKGVNDRFGHAAGDGLLQDVAARMGRRVRSSDTLARVGGDEFAVVQIGLQDPDGAARLARDIVEAMSEPFPLGDTEVQLGVSIGIAIHPRHGATSDTLLENADLALYRAKQADWSCWRFHDSLGPEASDPGS